MMIYIAVNGDDVGTRIGEHIASDDHESLQATRGAVQQAHQQIADWVTQNGGEEVSYSGDEGIYTIPEEAAEQLEDIRAQYEQTSGHTLTIGVGSSMSEASKALIYGKLNEKNQVVQYDPSLEDVISTEEGVPAQEPNDLSTEQPQDGEETYDKHPAEPEHEEEMAPEQEMEHDLAEQEEDEADPDNIEADEEAVTEGIDGKTFEQDYGTEDDEAEGQAEPENPDVADELGEDQPQEAIPTDEVEGESVYSDLAETGGEDPEAMGEEQVPGEEEPHDYNEDLTDMVESHMAGDEEMDERELAEGGLDEEVPAEEGMEGDGESIDPEQLKQDVARALMTFKQNKQMLEEAQTTNPEMYEATITMLRSMIDMAKELGIGTPVDEVPGEEEAAAAEEEAAPAEEEVTVEEAAAAEEEVAPAEEEEDGEKPEKK